MRTIHKYTLKQAQTIELHRGFKVLDIQVQGSDPVMWVEVDEIENKLPVKIEFFGTGWELPERAKEYLGTAQVDFGLVFHAYIVE